MKYPFVYYIHIYSYCYDHKCSHLHFVCGILHWQSSEIIVGYIFIICIRQYKKCVLYIFYYWFAYTQKHIYIQFDIPFREESGKRRNNCRSKTHFNDTRNGYTSSSTSTNDFRFESIGLLCVQCIFSAESEAFVDWLFSRLKWSWKSSNLGIVCVCVSKVFLQCLNNQKTT